MSENIDKLKDVLRKLDVAGDSLSAKVSRFQGQKQLLEQELKKKCGEFSEKYPKVDLEKVTDKQIQDGIVKCQKAVEDAQDLIQQCEQGGIDEKDDLI